MKKNLKKTTQKDQKKTELRKKRRERRKAALLGHVDLKTKKLTKNIKDLHTRLEQTQKALEESYLKVASLTQENVKLKKTTEKNKDQESEKQE